MKRSSFQLQISNPCQENWEGMSQTNEGKHCLSCAKNVLDFTHLSDKQVTAILDKAEGKICGRLHKTQLNRVVVTPKEQKRISTVYKFLAGLIALSNADNVQGQDIRPKQTIVGNYVINAQTVVADEQKSVSLSHNTPKFISGKVIDAETKEPLAGAAIQIKGTLFGTMADANGKFSLTIRESLLLDQMIIVVTYVGSKTLELIVNRKDLPVEKELLLVPDPYVLIGEVVVVNVKQKKKWWQRN